MTTISRDTVKTLPMVVSTSMSLDDIKNAMTLRVPSITGFHGGWASVSDYQSNLGNVGINPPRSAPVIEPQTESLPERLMARYYYWMQPQKAIRDASGYDPMKTRVLSAVDVILTQVRDGLIGIVFSTRTRSYLAGEGKIINALEDIFSTNGQDVKISRNESHLALANEEIFLWLAVRHRDHPTLSSELELDQISGVSATDEARRTAVLSSGIDFNRSNFLTSVAENDTLGPIDIGFIETFKDGRQSYEIRLHFDGGMELRRKSLRIPAEVDPSVYMRDTVARLTFDVIPRINDLFGADSSNWNAERTDVIRNAMGALEDRYRELRMILNSHLESGQGDDDSGSNSIELSSV